MTHPGAAGPKPNDDVLRRDRKEERQAQNRSHVNTEAAVGATWPPVQGRLEAPDAGRRRKVYPQEHGTGPRGCHTAGPQDCGRTNVCPVVICYGRPRTPVRGPHALISTTGGVEKVFPGGLSGADPYGVGPASLRGWEGPVCSPSCDSTQAFSIHLDPKSESPDMG